MNSLFDFVDKCSIDKLVVIKDFLSKALDTAEKNNLEPKELLKFEKIL